MKNRTIKFRAFDKNSKKMLYWDDIDREIKEKLCYRPMSALMGDCNNYIWMQYTGLKDKNDKEIYEGDILKSEYESIGIPKEKNCHPVIWRNGKWGCDHNINNCCKPWRGDLSGHHSSEEVIGNIFEDAFLLDNK